MREPPAHVVVPKVTSRDLATCGVSFEEARTLFLLATGATAPQSREALMAVRRLTHSGYVNVHPLPGATKDDTPRLTDNKVRFDLCLDEVGPTGLRVIGPKGNRPRKSWRPYREGDDQK